MLDGKAGLSWCGPTVQNFWTNYLVPLVRSDIRGSGEPMGGNFLFEDGHVRWYEFRRVTMGATGGNWIFYYNISLE